MVSLYSRALEGRGPVGLTGGVGARAPTNVPRPARVPSSGERPPGCPREPSTRAALPRPRPTPCSHSLVALVSHTAHVRASQEAEAIALLRALHSLRRSAPFACPLITDGAWALVLLSRRGAPPQASSGSATAERPRAGTARRPSWPARGGRARRARMARVSLL